MNRKVINVYQGLMNLQKDENGETDAMGMSVGRHRFKREREAGRQGGKKKLI